jgi:hypothetical protein
MPAKKGAKKALVAKKVVKTKATKTKTIAVTSDDSSSDDDFAQVEKDVAQMDKVAMAKLLAKFVHESKKANKVVKGKGRQPPKNNHTPTKSPNASPARTRKRGGSSLSPVRPSKSAKATDGTSTPKTNDGNDGNPKGDGRHGKFEEDWVSPRVVTRSATSKPTRNVLTLNTYSAEFANYGRMRQNFDIKPFSGGADENVKKFVRQFVSKSNSANLCAQEQREKLNICLEGSAANWLDRVGYSYDTVETILAELVKYYTASNDRGRQRLRKLKEMKQGSNEDIGEYTDRFEQMYGCVEIEEKEAVQIFCTSINDNICLRVLGTEPKTLYEATGQALKQTQIVQNYEESKGRRHPNLNSMSQAPVTRYRSAQAISPERNIDYRLQEIAVPAHTNAPYVPNKKVCGKCGKNGHSTDLCGVKCSNCHRLGHKLEKCRAAGGPAFKPRDMTSRYNCTFCRKSGHTADRCYQNPDSGSFKNGRPEN